MSLQSGCDIGHVASQCEISLYVYKYNRVLHDYAYTMTEPNQTYKEISTTYKRTLIPMSLVVLFASSGFLQI